MFIKSINLNNYRCHKNSKIDFFKDGSKGKISIIEGGDGDGKTCIFNAIGWCLYGKETSELLGEPKQNLGIPNVGLSGTGKLENLSVELWIDFEGETSDRPKSARIKRSADFRINEISREKLEVEMYYDTGSPRILSDKDAQRYIEDTVPSDLVEFYMFNGEYLSSNRNRMGKNIDASIKGQFKIGAIESMANLLKNAEDMYRRSAERAAGNDISGIASQIEDNKKKIKELESEKKELEGQYDYYSSESGKAKAELEKLRMEIMKIKGKQEVVKEFASKQDRLNEISKELDGKLAELHKAQYDFSYLELSKITNGESYKLVKNEIGRANLPPKIKEEFVHDLLSQHKCICGRPLEDNSTEYEKVESMLSDIINENKKNILIDLSPELKEISTERIMPAEEKVKSIKESIKNLSKIKGEISDDLSHWKSEEKNLSEDERESLEKYKNNIDDSNHFDALSGSTKDHLNNIQKDIDELEKRNNRLTEEEDKISRKNDKGARFVEYQNVARELHGIISQLANKIPSIFIESLQAEVNRLILDVRGLSHLSANIKQEGDSIKITYVDKYIDLDGKSFLSQGQTQIISIVLIASYMSVLKKLGAGIAETPFVVMDHPFSDLGLPRKEELLKSFSTIFKDTNVIILSPPGDFNLSPVAGIIASHYIVHNDESEKACNVIKKEDGI